MLNSVLYDRQIELRLFSTKNTREIVQVSNDLSTVYTGKKAPAIHRASLGLGDQKSRTIQIIEGYSHTYNDTKVNNEGTRITTRKTFHARGPLFKVNTMSEMRSGMRPGTRAPYQLGDKIYVRENKTKWHVFTSLAEGTVEGVTDPAYSITSAPAINPEFVIGSPKAGMKPNITFSINLLPNQNCYRAIVRVKNLIIPGVNVRDWDQMEITAGYGSGLFASFTCPIFTSYIESPNPDGVTVFEGITVGQASGVLQSSFIKVSFLGTQVTLDSLVRECARGIAPNVDVKITIPDEIMKETVVKILKQDVYAENGLALLSWLQTTVTKILKEQHNISALLNFMNGTLLLMSIDGVNKIPEVRENVVNLDMVSGATFNGTALTVEAPWNPALRPGDLFYMPPSFINGSKLPNSLDPSTYMNEENMYRVLTMSISFSTVEKANNMSILAVPAQYVEKFTTNAISEMSAEQYARYRQKLIGDGSTTNSIEIGDPAAEDQVAKQITESSVPKAQVEMFDANRAAVASMSSDAFTIPPGSCLSSIARQIGTDSISSPKDRTFNPTREELQNSGIPRITEALLHYQSSGIPFDVLWWPLIAVATYWSKVQADETGLSHNWESIDLINPDLIHEGKQLFVPRVTLSGDHNQYYRTLLGPVKNIYKDAYNNYGGKKGYESWRIQWRAAYYYLGGTDDLE